MKKENNLIRLNYHTSYPKNRKRKRYLYLQDTERVEKLLKQTEELNTDYIIRLITLRTHCKTN